MGGPTCFEIEMFSEEFYVFFVCSIFCGLRSNEVQQLLWGMGGPTQWGWDEEGVAKETLFWIVVMGDRLLSTGGRASLQKNGQYRDYDDTMGYPGEDVSPNF